MNINFKRVTLHKWNIRDFILAVIFLLCMEIDSIPYLTHINSQFFSYVSLLITLGYVVAIIRRKRLSNAMIIILLFFGWYLASVFLNSPRNVFAALRNISSPLSIAIVVEYSFPQKCWKLIAILQELFIALIIIDIITMILYPQGLYTTDLYWNNWFLGYKSARVREVGIPYILVASLNSIHNSGKLDIKFWIIAALTCVDAFLSEATGGTVTLIVYILIMFLLFTAKHQKIRTSVMKLINPWIVFISVVILNLIFAIFQNYSMFEYIITVILDKNMTLTNRNRIWYTSLNLFLKSPITGRGYISGTDYIFLTGVRGGTQPHNLLLAIMVYMGIIGVILYLLLIMRSIRLVNKSIPSYTTIVFFGIVAYMIFGIVSFTMLAPFHYALFVMLYYFAVNERAGKD